MPHPAPSILHEVKDLTANSQAREIVPLPGPNRTITYAPAEGVEGGGVALAFSAAGVPLRWAIRSMMARALR
jgi:hypothetical protein